MTLGRKRAKPAAMRNPEPKPKQNRGADGADAVARREARLAASLRANLGRRKAQARARADAEPPQRKRD
ncbi:MAG: hypothetical protein ACREFQ_06750 [Stellaceae bacterium]